MSSLVPEGWTKERLGDHVKLESGNAFQSLEFSDKGTPIVRISNIRNDKIDLLNAVYYEGNNHLEKFLIADGDILLAMSGATTGKIGKYTYSFKSYLNQRVGRFKIIDETKSENEYIYQLVRSREFAENTLIDAIGGAQPNISSSQVENVVYKFPPLPEQKKIASILTSVDEVIENTQKQIDKLQDLKKATMNELLTKGIGHTEFKDSELGQIPKCWEVIALAGLLELKNGLNTKADAFGSGSPFLSYKDIYKDTELTEMSLSQKVAVSERENNSFSVNYGDVFFTRTSETPEEIGFANVYLGKNVGAVFNGFCIRGRPITNKLSVRLSRFLFRSDYVRVQMKFLCKYTTRAGISGESLNKCLLAVPPIDEQEKYLKTLNSIEKIIEAAGKKLSQTQSLKKSLMQDLLTGKVRVTVN